MLSVLPVISPPLKNPAEGKCSSVRTTSFPSLTMAIHTLRNPLFLSAIETENALDFPIKGDGSAMSIWGFSPSSRVSSSHRTNNNKRLPPISASHCFFILFFSFKGLHSAKRIVIERIKITVQIPRIKISFRFLTFQGVKDKYFSKPKWAVRRIFQM